MDCASMSLDDLDEKLFVVELSNYQVERQEQPAVSGSNKRRLWHWKHTLTNPIDKKDTMIGKAQSSSSLDNSRHGSVCSSSHSSPIRSSPKKSKDQQLKKAIVETKDDVGQKTRKDNNVKCDSVFPDDRLATANAHLYSVLEEQALGELIHESAENVYTEGNNRSISFYTNAALSSNIWYYHLSYNIIGWRKSPHAMIFLKFTNLQLCFDSVYTLAHARAISIAELWQFMWSCDGCSFQNYRALSYNEIYAITKKI